MTKASKAISCDGCDAWTHVRCSGSVSLAKYNECVKDGGDISFVCDRCGFSSLPFVNADVGEDDVGIAGARAVPAPQVDASSFSSCPLPPSLSLKGLHFIHANVRSLLPKLPEVHLFLSRTKAAVFAASETWLDSTVNDGEVEITGFNVVRRDRNRNGGGVALYIRDSIAFNLRPDLAVDGLEAVWIELLLPRTKGILVCSIYRPPADNGFLEKLESSLSKVDPGSEIHILGDFNIDFSQPHSPLLSKYTEILDFFGLEQLITEPTRITPTSSSLIDHIVTNSRDLVRASGTVVVGFSDHLITFSSRIFPKVASAPNVKKVRSMKDYSKEGFLSELAKVDWSSVLSSDNADYCVTEFSRLFNSAVDKVAPYREIRVRSKKNPWINPGILSLIKRRDALFSEFRKNRSDENLYKEYCRVRNMVQRDIKQAKANYFRHSIEQNRGKSDKLWGHLKSLGYKKAPGPSSNIVLEDGGKKVFDSFHVAQIFNRFYTSVASNLVSKLPSPPGIFGTATKVFKDFYRNKVGSRPSFVLSPVTSHFIRRQLNSLDPKKAIGLDDLSSRFLRDGTEHIISPVTHIINISIITEKVPTSFKEARVVPLFKKGSRLDPGNYRPVSILSVLSKVLERAVH